MAKAKVQAQHEPGAGVAAVYLPLDALRPNPRNPRIHGEDVERLARTILRTTWGAPIIAQASTRRIIGGHGRLEAARRIAAGIEVDGILRGGADHRFDRDAPGPLLLPVRLVDVSDAEADAMTLADNAVALQGRDDAASIVAMATASFERDATVMRDMGLGADALDALVKAAGDAVLAEAAAAAADTAVSPPGEVEPEVDKLAELRTKWGTVRGQVWEIRGANGTHRIVCGDATNADDVALALGGVKPDVVFTDPPYDWPAETQVGVCFGISDAAVVSGCGPQYARLAGVDGVRFWYEVISLRKMPRSMPLWPGPFVMHWQNAFITKGGDHPFHRRNAKGRFGNGDWFPSVRGPYECGEFEHGHSKSVAWAHEIISMMEAAVVADPFLGSGTVMVAAEQCGRRCIGIEIDPGFVAVALERLSSMGLNPELVESPSLASQPQKTAVAASVPGGTYRLGGHVLSCADGRAADVSGRVLVLDPPYDVPGLYEIGHRSRGAAAVLLFHGYAISDEVVRVMASWPHKFQFVWDGVSSWWTPNRPLARHKCCTVLMAEPHWATDLSVIPGNPGPARTVTNTRGSYEYEPAHTDKVRLSTVFTSPTTREASGHPHSKPADWITALLAGVKATRVVDPFAGSGTSIISAARIGATVEAFEINPAACDVIRKRWTRLCESAGVSPGDGALVG